MVIIHPEFYMIAVHNNTQDIWLVRFKVGSVALSRIALQISTFACEIESIISRTVHCKKREMGLPQTSYNKNHIVEEPDDAKATCPVLKPSVEGDFHA